MKKWPWILIAFFVALFLFGTRNTAWGIFGESNQPTPNQTSNNAVESVSPNPTNNIQSAPTQAEKDRCEILAEEYARNNAQAQIDASDRQTIAMGGRVLVEGDPTKVGSYEPDMKRAYLNCINNTNY